MAFARASSLWHREGFVYISLNFRQVRLVGKLFSTLCWTQIAPIIKNGQLLSKEKRNGSPLMPPMLYYWIYADWFSSIAQFLRPYDDTENLGWPP